MSPVFTINFRREAYQREQARARQRLFQLGGWLAYFGVLAVVIGLYGLNCGALISRTRQVERLVERAARTPGASPEWRVEGTTLVAVESFRASAPRWRQRLIRLAELLPPTAALSTIEANPENTQLDADRNRLVITGFIRVPAGQDRMRPVADLIARLRGDSLFATGYSSIRLSSSRAVEASNPETEFVIECR
ncbi:MAG: hypothetical protein HOP12_00485 [Candidatus Eisenbacteria bacterium]|uniref:PilN domain-containing protein n=1 Tax=Eiseniibacteriota bacterium TaxID=2212470 RepID=A0A849SAD3_UNCEI|nr:hypothetical protein [Candidatus Eisenbacteria bacterium]